MFKIGDKVRVKWLYEHQKYYVNKLMIDVDYDVTSDYGPNYLNGDVTIELRGVRHDVSQQQIELVKENDTMFKVGDKVRVLKDEKSCDSTFLQSGEICEIISYSCDGERIWIQSDNPTYLNGSWYTDIDNIELVKENDTMKELKVDSLDHVMKVVDGRLKVGCQSISKDDAKLIAEFIHDVRFNGYLFDKPKIELGVWYSSDNYAYRMFIRTGMEYLAINRQGLECETRDTLNEVTSGYTNLRKA